MKYIITINLIITAALTGFLFFKNHQTSDSIMELHNKINPVLTDVLHLKIINECEYEGGKIYTLEDTESFNFEASETLDTIALTCKKDGILYLHSKYSGWYSSGRTLGN